MPKEIVSTCACTEELTPDLELGWKEFARQGGKKEDCPHRIIEFASPAMTESVLAYVENLQSFTVMAVRWYQADRVQLAKPFSESIASIINNDPAYSQWIIAEGGYGMVFCIIPKVDSQYTSEASQTLIKTLSETAGINVNTGTANYPFGAYSRKDAFLNSVKAYYHALFFGEGSQAEFDSTSLNISGDLFYQAGEITNAITEYQKGLDIDPMNTNIMNSLGVCLAYEKDYKTALTLFEKAAQINPSEYLAVYNAGVACVFTGEFEKARDLFIKAAEAGSADIKIAFQAGKAALEKGDPETAAKLLKKATEMSPEKSEPYRYLGEAYSKTERMDKAISAYKKAVKLNPCDANSFSALGALFAETGENLEIAMVFCNQSIALSPQNGLMHFRAAQTLLKMNREDLALQSFKKAHELGYDSSYEIEAIKKTRLGIAS